MTRRALLPLAVALSALTCAEKVPTSSGQAVPECGNGVRRVSEACDGNDLAGQSCTSAGYDGGVLACAGDCTYSFSACTGTAPSCGDGVLEGFEQCEAANLGGATCSAVGFGGGTLACTGNCAFDTSGCS